ncbi:NAD-dependent epimerase/dehydratase family protein [Streptomyces sp. NPDC051956]|uniref:NAD-dependent epimerase/dehydratase family protein n=1 Tax=Streptomyces sp. NPDC051956 TaxID=3365677 RepID=UPI0037D0A093
MATSRILVTGGSGFVGSRVAALLADARHADDAVAVRLLVHTSRPVVCESPRIQTHHGSLSDAASLRGVCDGVDTVLHLASQIGGDPERCSAVNDAGTRALLAEAARAGVGRIIQLGTTAVYRDGRHRGAVEGELPLGPTSPTSIARLAGEEQVLAADGVVLRPHLIYGRGDTWVVPALAQFMTAIPCWVNGGRALISMIGADDLAQAIVSLALHPALPRGTVLHASRPEPVRVRELIHAAAQKLGLPLPVGEVAYERAAELLDTAHDRAALRRLSLLAADHWYDSSRLWRLLDSAPARGFAEDFADSAPWYRQYLAGSRHSAPVLSARSRSHAPRVSVPTRTAGPVRSAG